MTLSDLRRLDGEASPSPWFTWRAIPDGMTVQRAAGFVAVMSSRGTDEDAALIAAARNSLGALLDVAEAARELLAQVTISEGTPGREMRGVWMKGAVDHAAYALRLRAALARLEGP